MSKTHLCIAASVVYESDRPSVRTIMHELRYYDQLQNSRYIV